MNQSKGKTIFVWLVQIVLALLFLGAALGKLTSNPQWIERFRVYGYPDGFCMLIGVLEAAGAIGLLIPRTARYAAMGLRVRCIARGCRLHSEGVAHEIRSAGSGTRSGPIIIGVNTTQAITLDFQFRVL